MSPYSPLVTCIVICYNHARFVLECLESVRLQTFRDIELLVVDDCSTDSSPILIQKWLKQFDRPYQFIHHERNRGICASLNSAVRQAQGKYISLIASDDVWELNKLEAQVQMLEAEPEEVGVIYSDAYQIGENSNLYPKKFIESHDLNGFPPSGDLHEVLWTNGNFIPAMSTLIRKACFDKVGQYDEALAYEDWDMWLRIARHYHFRYSPVISARYRIVGNSMVRSQWPRLCDASVDVCLKFVVDAALPSNVRALIRSQLRDKAKRSYKVRSPRFRRNLAYACWRAPSPSMLLCSAFGLLGAHYSQYQVVISLLKNRLDGCGGRLTKGNSRLNSLVNRQNTDRI